jgi:hypothetical protein
VKVELIASLAMVACTMGVDCNLLDATGCSPGYTLQESLAAVTVEHVDIAQLADLR